MEECESGRQGRLPQRRGDRGEFLIRNSGRQEKNAKNVALPLASHPHESVSPSDFFPFLIS
jgi:hypothetical protein